MNTKSLSHISKYCKLGTLLIATAFIFSACSINEPTEPQEPGKYAEVAKCLTEKGVKLYGAYWCPHCHEQKEDFGSDVQFISYVECDDSGPNGNHKACLEAGITSYPTWVFPGQGNLIGRYPIFVLAKLANCQDKLPPEDQELLREAEVAIEESSGQVEEVSNQTEESNTEELMPEGTETEQNTEDLMSDGTGEEQNAENLTPGETGGV